jgi:hypothetical protein
MEVPGVIAAVPATRYPQCKRLPGGECLTSLDFALEPTACKLVLPFEAEEAMHRQPA